MTNPSHDPVCAGDVRPAAPSVRGRLALHLGVVLLVAGAAGDWLGGPSAAISAMSGVAVSAVNLLVMRRITSALTGGGGSAWLALLPFKLIALVGVAYALVATKVAQPVPLAVGFALLPLTAVFLPRLPAPFQPSSRVRYPGPILPGRAGNH